MTLGGGGGEERHEAAEERERAGHQQHRGAGVLFTLTKLDIIVGTNHRANQNCFGEFHLIHIVSELSELYDELTRQLSSSEFGKRDKVEFGRCSSIYLLHLDSL